MARHASLSSPLSSMSSLSSPASFVTATASPANLADVTTTDITTPGDKNPEVVYRKARQLPSELKEHCRIYLEENLQSFSLQVLNDLLPGRGAPVQRRRDAQRNTDGAYCPPPNQLSLLSGIIVHPDFTTRPKEANWPEVASSSLEYLRNLLHTVGPVNGRFKEAFRFASDSRTSRGGSPGSESSSKSAGDLDLWGETQLRGRYAKESVWRLGQDLFSVVGWAFNCSVIYPNRWEYWRQWLELMLDVLEADLLERHRLDCEAQGQAGLRTGDHDGSRLLSDSILAGYINQRSGRAGGLKWIMRAIFADGSKASNSLFQEIWPKEHKGRSKMANRKRKRELSLEKGDYGWLDDDCISSSQGSEPPTPQKRKATWEKDEPLALETAYVESIASRQRLFVLLSYLCFHLPEPPIEVGDLYEGYTESLRSLPLPIFTAFIMFSTSQLRLDSQISILSTLMELLMPSTAVKPSKIDNDRYSDNGTSPAILERCFLPYAANTLAAEDNAKVSLLLEELMQIIWVDGTENFSDGLLDIVNKGRTAREAKVGTKKTRGRGRPRMVAEDTDSEAKAVLQESGKRLIMLAELIQAEADSEASDADEKKMEQDREGSVEISFMSAQSS